MTEGGWKSIDPAATALEFNPLPRGEGGERSETGEGLQGDSAIISKPHPEEGRRPVSKDAGRIDAPSFETRPQKGAPQDEAFFFNPASGQGASLTFDPFNIGQLKIGDVLISKDGPVPLFRIDSEKGLPATPLFNFRLTGNQTYFVREKGSATPFLLVHNK